MDALVDPALVLFLFGGVMLVATLFRRSWGLASLLAVGLASFYLLSSGPGAELLLQPLERVYPPLRTPPRVSAILVLSGGEGHAENRPIPSSLSSTSLDRLVEGVRLFWGSGGLPELWFVGGEGVVGGGIPLIAQAARDLGVPTEKIRWLTGSRNTWEDAAVVAAHLGDQRFVLVTSAFHMRRALWAFRAHGLNPIPAPCGHRAPILRTFRSFLPQSQFLFSSALALREYLGLLWYWFRYR
jgi:uncharacterized SAM-binding protein YcdF (DUF218 family)